MLECYAGRVLPKKSSGIHNNASLLDPGLRGGLARWELGPTPMGPGRAQFKE